MISKIGIHSIKPNKVLSYVAEAKLKGFCFPVVKAVDDTGVAIDVKKLCPQTITITRFNTDSFVSLQGLETWNDDQRKVVAKKLIDYLFTRTQNKPDIMAAADYFEIINEASPKGFYDFYGLFLISLMNEAKSRNIKLALPAFNAGTPEWDDIVKFVKTGVMQVMFDYGFILSVHEGIFDDGPITEGFGDIIPGAPKVDGAGSLCFRYRYLYSLLTNKPKLVVSEFRANSSHLASSDVLARLKWYDMEAQKDDYLLAFLPFTIDPDAHWLNSDYTYTYEDIINYMQSVKDQNPVPTPVPVSNKMLIGLHGRADGRMQQKDFAVVQQAKIEAVKLLSTAAPEDVDSLKSINSNIFIMVRLFADFSNRILTPEDFVNSVKDDMRNFYNKGVRYFEIHNEPNLYTEGFARSWHNGIDFTNWFNSVAGQLRNLFPDIKLGFPGVSPGNAVDGVRFDSVTFLNQIGVIGCDWIGVHVYWSTQDELNNINVGVYQKFNKPLFITEFSNVSNVDKIIKGNQYIQFYNMNLANAAFAFVVSASNSDFSNETWRDELGNLSAIPTIVGSRNMSNIGKKATVKPNVFLNVRSGPGTNFPLIGTLAAASVFTVLEENGIWIRITEKDWVSSFYVNMS